jgi:S-adenosylmethionine:tRNA ribosyltransferase-isomerase
MTTTIPAPLAFELPTNLVATEPAEIRGGGRDDVRMLVAEESTIRHEPFRALPSLLSPGDLIVVNTSATLPAALDARGPGGEPLAVHLSTHLPGDLWTIEVRIPSQEGSRPGGDLDVPVRLALPGGAEARVLAPLVAGGIPRLWLARLHGTGPIHPYLYEHGSPIVYGPTRWPLSYYQTVYATEPGSAEMPSAGRAFTPALITELVARGIGFAPLVLHCGVSSPEAGEPPYEEPYRVPAATAGQVNETRASGGRVIAVGTTVVRALETVTDRRGIVHPGEGWTELLVTRDHELRAIDALLTGWHEPRASHLQMIEAIAGPETLRCSYNAALEQGYRWHEFGDLHLILA